MIYLDSAATTRVSDGVMEAMLPYFQEQFANAGSVHYFGSRSAKAVKRARAQIAEFFGANPEQIIFTSGGTEGNHFALHSPSERLLQEGKRHIIVSSVEHDSVLRAAESLMKHGFYIDYLPVNRHGSVEYDEFLRLLRPDTGLVSVMYVNNETGAVNPVQRIGKYCSQNGILFHTDCVQAAGCLPVRVDELCCDFATISSHKIHGPKGVGAVYVRNPELCSPVIPGGANQEFGLRGGTENVPAIVGFGQAAEDATECYLERTSHIEHLKNMFLQIIKEQLKDDLTINGPECFWPGKVLNCSVSGIDGESMLLMLSAYGVCVSTGSACRSSENHPSRVLMAMGRTPQEARRSVRVSFSKDNTEEEVAEAAQIFISCVNELRSGCFDL